MKQTKEINQLLAARKARLSLTSLVILKILNRKPLYMAQLCEVLDTNPGTLNKAVNVVMKHSYVKKTRREAATGYAGSNYSALLSLTAKGKLLLESLS